MTNEEAKELIELFKKIAKGKLIIPSQGKHVFDFFSTTTRDKFTVSIFRGSYNSKTSYVGLLKGTNEVLIRLDVTPNGRHRNPDGELILGTHIHVFTEEYGDKFAINLDLISEDTLENCIIFFKRFNIIETEIVDSKTLSLH